MKIKRRGKTLEIRFDSHDESIRFLKQAGFKNLPHGTKTQAVEQTLAPDFCDCGEPFPKSGYCMFCGARARYTGEA